MAFTRIRPLAPSVNLLRRDPDQRAFRSGTSVGLAPRDPAEAEQVPAGGLLLGSGADRRRNRPLGVGAGLRAAHPVLSLVAVVALGYMALAVVLIGSGLLFTHVVAHDRVGHWDDHVNSWLAAHRSKTWNGVSADFTLLANTLGVAVGAAVVCGVLLVRRTVRLAVFLLIGLGIELAVFLSTTYLVARPRPQVQRLGSTPSTFSWPSGHAAATLALYGGIALVVTFVGSRRAARIVAWVLAAALTAAVALSRVYRGEHHLSDTLAGAALGAGALWVAVVALRVWVDPQRGQQPGVGPEGVLA